MPQNSQWLKVQLGLAALISAQVGIGAIGVAQLPPPPASLEPAPPQPSYSTCQPPAPGEYLLLVVSKTPESQDRVRRVLPAGVTAIVCTYLNDVVTRVGGFATVDSANAWSRYLTESGLSAFVARPADGVATQAPQPPNLQPSVPQAPVVPPQPTIAKPAPTSSPQSLTFNPQLLGTGYAVLVDFFNQPELAAQVQQQLGKEIGLVSYRQRPYLLAVHTSDQTTANSTLQSLTDRGFWAMVVDSRRVTLLRQSVSRSR